MPLTLAQAKVGMADKVDQTVIDEFRRSSYLLDKLIFDDAVSPGTGGSTLVYGYEKLLTPSTAAFRALNTDYTPNEAVRQKLTANLKIFGGSYSLDRVIINSAGTIDELNLQLMQKIKAAANLFNYTAINGDSSTNADEFDGLDKLITGATTEVTATGLDLSTAALMNANYNALLDMVDEWLRTLEEKPNILMMNSRMLTIMKQAARRAGYYTRSEDAFGRTVDNYDNIPMIDMGKYYNGTSSVDCVGIDATAGTTTIYAACTDLLGFHGASIKGSKVIEHHLPDLDKPGVMKTGDVEMVSAVVLKNTLRAGALRGIKVQ